MQNATPRAYQAATPRTMEVGTLAVLGLLRCGHSDSHQP